MILLFSTSISFCNLVLTQDCFTQIISLGINQPALEIGESLQVNIVYDLYYDPLDPLGIGSVSITIGIQEKIEFIAQHQLSDTGFNINKEIILDISPSHWAPNETGQIGIVKVEAWVQDSFGTMTDSVEQPFTVLRSPLIMDITPLPSSIYYHEIINLSGSLHNPNNASVQIPNHIIDITIFQETQIIQSYLQNTALQSNFTQSIDTELIGTGTFNCNITAQANDDYSQEITSLSFFVSNGNLTLSTASNSSIIQTYYPLMTNCSVLVSADLNCQLFGHSAEGANVTCSLGNSTKLMSYFEPNHFSAVLSAPYYPGNYSITVRASIPNHNPISNVIPIQVVQRKAIIQLKSNCSLAAYGDIIQLTIRAIDETTQIPLSNKICSVFLFNQSIWNLLAQVMLDQNGIAEIYWQARNVGDQDFRFKIVLSGDPEYVNEEFEHTVINTHEFRFFLNSTITVVRQSITNYSIRITTLDFQPLSNINVSLIEILTNISWCTLTTNASGHAILSWYIDSQYDLGLHEFLLIAQDELATIGSIPITMVVFEQTILVVV
jgi:hypothetical protein